MSARRLVSLALCLIIFSAMALRAAESALDLQRQGIRLDSQGQSEEALQKLRHAVALDANDPSNYLALGMVALKAGKFGEARAALEKTVQLDPNSPSGRFHLAMLYERAKESAKARAEWEKLLRLSPDAATKEIAERHLGRLGAP